jgi:hypothetical protein
MPGCNFFSIRDGEDVNRDRESKEQSFRKLAEEIQKMFWDAFSEDPQPYGIQPSDNLSAVV